MRLGLPRIRSRKQQIIKNGVKNAEERMCG